MIHVFYLTHCEYLCISLKKYYWSQSLGFCIKPLVVQMINNLPTMKETWSDPWFGKIPPEDEMATHSNILAWKIPQTEEPGRLQSTGSERVGHD